MTTATQNTNPFGANYVSLAKAPLLASERAGVQFNTGRAINALKLPAYEDNVKTENQLALFPQWALGQSKNKEQVAKFMGKTILDDMDDINTKTYYNFMSKYITNPNVLQNDGYDNY